MLDGTNIDAERVSVLFPTTLFRAEVDAFATITGRLGYAVSPAFLLYGKFGWGAYKTSLTAIDTLTGAEIGSVSRRRGGLDLGFGGEWMFAPNWSLWIEWDHIFPKDQTVFFANLGPVGTTANVRRDFDKVLVGVNWRFGGGGGARGARRLLIARRFSLKIVPQRLKPRFVAGLACVCGGVNSPATAALRNSDQNARHPVHVPFYSPFSRFPFSWFIVPKTLPPLNKVGVRKGASYGRDPVAAEGSHTSRPSDSSVGMFSAGRASRSRHSITNKRAKAAPVIVHAIQVRATNDRRACAVHLPLVLYLACVTALLGLFASIVYGQMQPTVIPNAGLAGYKAPAPENLFLHKPDLSAEEMERAAIDAAETENRDQGIEPLLAFAAVEPAAAKPGGVPRQHRDCAPCEAGEAETEACCQTEPRCRSLALLVERSLALMGARAAVEQQSRTDRRSSAVAIRTRILALTSSSKSPYRRRGGSVSTLVCCDRQR